MVTLSLQVNIKGLSTIAAFINSTVHGQLGTPLMHFEKSSYKNWGFDQQNTCQTLSLQPS